MRLDGEEGAVFDLAGEVGALVDGGLEEVLVPAHHEVAVVAVAWEQVSWDKESREEMRNDLPVGSPLEMMNFPLLPAKALVAQMVS